MTSENLTCVSKLLSIHLGQLWCAKANLEENPCKRPGTHRHFILSNLSETAFLLQDFFRLRRSERLIVEPSLRQQIFGSYDKVIYFTLNYLTFYDRQLAYDLLISFCIMFHLLRRDLSKISEPEIWLKKIHNDLMVHDVTMGNFPLLKDPEDIFLRKINKAEKLMISIESELNEVNSIINRLNMLENK